MHSHGTASDFPHSCPSRKYSFMVSSFKMQNTNYSTVTIFVVKLHGRGCVVRCLVFDGRNHIFMFTECCSLYLR